MRVHANALVLATGRRKWRLLACIGLLFRHRRPIGMLGALGTPPIAHHHRASHSCDFARLVLETQSVDMRCRSHAFEPSFLL